jgi:hypothetical protein
MNTRCVAAWTELQPPGPNRGALVALHLGGLVDRAAMFHIRAPCLATEQTPEAASGSSETTRRAATSNSTGFC